MDMKKYYYIGAGVLILILLLSKKSMAKSESKKTPVVPSPKKPSTPSSPPTLDEEKNALSKIIKEYGRDTAKKVEQMFRQETGHFKSGGYKKTNGAGMEAAKRKGKVIDTFPYGWNPKLFEGVNITGLINLIDSGGRDVFFIKFATKYDGMKVLANFLQIRKLGSWFSLNPDAQKQYETKVFSIVPKIVNSL